MFSRRSSVFPNVCLPVLPSSIWGDVPVEQWQTDPGSTGTDPSRVVGSGPFKFVEINEGEGTTTLAAQRRLLGHEGRRRDGHLSGLAG